GRRSRALNVPGGARANHVKNFAAGPRGGRAGAEPRVDARPGDRCGGSFAADVRLEPWRAGPVPVGRAERLDMAVGEQDVAAAVVSEVRTAPVRIAGRGHAPGARGVVGRVMDDPRAGLLGGVGGDTPEAVGRV